MNGMGNGSLHAPTAHHNMTTKPCMHGLENLGSYVLTTHPYYNMAMCMCEVKCMYHVLWITYHESCIMSYRTHCQV